MKVTISSIALLLLFSLTVSAQNIYSIKGSVTDTTKKTTLFNTTVMVVSARDSILQKSTRVKADGSFAISGLPPGTFRLFLSYPGYANYSDAFILGPDKKEVDFGKINMELKSQLLQDVIIKGTPTPIKIKGDTIEFNAKSYVIQPNDRVEDLIKQFPGIQVDKDGKITAEGQEVKKVLVDGEEFFGDDPTLVTKNIRADMVDKVQLYDKKSDQATFTGIDDGEKTKTLNIQLRQDKKKGYFGKVDGGIGTNGYYSGQGMYNKFTATQKFAAYTTDSNTGKTGLGFQDNTKYADNGSVTVDDNGGISIYFDGDDGLDSFSGQYSGQGIPKATTGGVHYDGKFNKNTETVNSNYKIGELDVDGTRSSLSENNLPTGAINTTNNQAFKNTMLRQKLDMAYVINLDTAQTLKLTADGTYKHSTVDNTTSTSSSHVDTLLNTSNRHVTNTNNEHLFNASAFYTKKLKKKGRTLSVLLSTKIDDNHGSGFLKSETDFYNPTGALDSTQLIDQQKTLDTHNTIFNSNITYTEPLTSKWSLILNYGVNINNGTSDRRSYNPSSPGNYNIIVDSLSDSYKLDQLSNHGGVMLNYKTGKGILNFGTKASDVAFKQLDGYTGDVLKRHFINWDPQMNFQYRFTQQKSLYINYNGNTTQPSITQIQPVRVNTDPLNITVGNASLKPSFNNRVSMSYYSYDVLTDQYFDIYGNYGNTFNQIVNSTVTDPASGKSTIQYVNLIGKTPSSFNSNLSFGRKIQSVGWWLGVSLNANAYRNYAYTDKILVSSNSGVYSIKPAINKNVKNVIDFAISAGPTYNVSNSSLQTQLSDNYRGFAANSYLNIYLPKKFQLSSDVNYTYQSKTETFDQDQKKTIWNATISKSFFKQNDLKLSLSGNDLLNQNVAFYRSTNANLISQSTYTTIKRYFMFSVTWNFTKMGGVSAPNK